MFIDVGSLLEGTLSNYDNKYARDEHPNVFQSI